MKIKDLLAATFLLPLAAPAALSAQTIVPLQQFKSIELRGGGKVTLRHGSVQRVTLVRGSTEFTEMEVVRTSNNARAEHLVIAACNERCPQRYDLEIDIVTPDISAVAVKGGGQITVAEGFPRQNSLAAAVHGGGAINARALAVNDAAASVNGGGSLLVHPTNALAASINGGGSVRYVGNPTVNSSINGGGSVSRE